MKLINLFLRVTIAAGFLSAIADRFGLWSKENSVWGNWVNFLEYTKSLNPWFPEAMIPTIGVIATGLEILFGICLLIGFKTSFFAKCSGLLLLSFAISMTFSVGIKTALDYSVFPTAATAFALGFMKTSYFELDNLIKKS